MDFLFDGYKLKFIQKDRCTDKSAHLSTHILKFFLPVTKYHYILRAEHHEENVFAVKFYCKKDRGSDYKYSRIINKGDLGNIVVSCLKVIPILLHWYPSASFGFVGARSYDPNGQVFEQIELTQRFKIWSYVVKKKIGHATFDHYQYPEVSGYLLLNRNDTGSLKETSIKKMFIQTYSGFSDLMV